MKTPPLFFFLCLAVPSVFAEARPNVLLLFIDDLKPMTRDYGHGQMETPNFDRLARSGLRFENAYCQVPTCGASRASLMTSLYPTIGRFPDFLTRAEVDALEQPTLPQRFKEAGYVTVSNGKVFHHQEDTDARSWSEPAWRPETGGTTFYNDETAAFLETSTAFRKVRGMKNPRKKVPMFEKGKVDPMETHDGLIAAKTMEDLERLSAGDRPFFVACGFAKPHMPFFSPEKTWEPYELDSIATASHRTRPIPTPLSLREVKEQFSYLPGTHDLTEELEYNSEAYHRHMRQGYYASVTHADDLTGRILDKLETLGLDENTYVVVLGDHGWLLGEHNEWAKNQLLHEALRTAMWMKGPGVAKGAAVDTFVEFVDILPTLCELAGIPLDEETIHGRSFAPVLTDPAAAHRDHAYTRFESGDAISAKDHFYVSWNSKEIGKESLLIDRVNDPEGAHNVSADAAFATAVTELEAKVQAKIREARSLPLPTQVAGTTVDIEATIRSEKPQGVVISHGGLAYGYALHFVEGRPALSVRNGKELYQLISDTPVRGRVQLAARIGVKQLILRVNGKVAKGEPSGLLKQQPVGGVSVGMDRKDPVGDYSSPHAFRGEILALRLRTGLNPELSAAMSASPVAAEPAP